VLSFKELGCGGGTPPFFPNITQTSYVLQMIKYTYKRLNKMETIKFKKVLLAMFALITAPGKYAVQVLSNVSDANLYTDEVTGKQRYIVNLRAIAEDKKAEVFETFKDVEEVAIEDTNGLFLTASIWKNSPEHQPALPMKNEFVDVTVDYVADREGVQVLRITNMQVKAAKVAAKFSFDPLPLEQAATANAAIEEHAGVIEH